MSKSQSKFWETQPVEQPGDKSLPQGVIETPTRLSEVKQEPYNLPSPYEWTTCDMNSNDICSEVHNFLKVHFPDDGHAYKVHYSKEFIKWALCPPSYYKSFYIGVRAKTSQKLVAFISSVPARIRVRKKIIEMAKIQFLCVHKNYLSRFGIANEFEEKDVEHWLLPREDVVYSYVVESPDTHEVTDMCSFYTVPLTIVGNPKYTTVECAYSYYNVATKTSFRQLMNDALIVAKQKGFDVFYALDVMQNESFF